MSERGSGPHPRSRRSRRGWWPSAAQAGILALVLATATAGAVSLRISDSLETAVGQESPTDFLTHWQPTGSLATTIPLPTPARLSANVVAPTRLPAASASRSLNLAVIGHLALEWTFAESAGAPANTEIEIAFTVYYLVGTTATTYSHTVYVETQGASPTGTLVFSIYWDSGHAAGVTFVSQIEISQVCVAVGTCP